MPIEYLLPIVFFFVATAYSSVGFGGGSSYLAILSIFLTNFYEIRSTSLVLNLVVVSFGTIMFIRHRVFDWKQFWPFLISSIPLAFIGASMKLSEKAFFLFLGGLLIFSGALLVNRFLTAHLKSRHFNLTTRLSIGGGIGFISGLTGIGGGIYLSPFLNLMGWKDPRKVASLASVFILANSFSGLSGLVLNEFFAVNSGLLWKLIVGVLFGAILGSYLSNQKLNIRVLGLLTAVLVTYVGLRLLLLYGFDLKI